MFAFPFDELNSLDSIIKLELGHMVLFISQLGVTAYEGDKADEYTC